MRPIRTLYAATLAAALFAGTAAFAQKKIETGTAGIIDTGTFGFVESGTGLGGILLDGATQSMSGGAQTQTVMGTQTATENRGGVINGERLIGGTLGGKALVKRTLGTHVIWQAAAGILLTRQMTSNSTPAPYSCGASSQYGTGDQFAAWKCFEGTTSNYYGSAVEAFSGGVGSAVIWYDFGREKRIARVVIKSTSYSGYKNYEPRDLNIYVGASADIASATLVFSIADCPHAPAINSTQIDASFSLTRGQYVFVRVTKIYGTAGQNLNIGEIELYGHE